MFLSCRSNEYFVLAVLKKETKVENCHRQICKMLIGIVVDYGRMNW